MAGTNEFIHLMHELVTFVRVADAGNFSKAARQMSLTPSAVSRQMARLEKELDVKLIHRTTRQLRLTEAGLKVYERGRDMVQAAQASMQVAKEHMQIPRGLVRISAPKAFARHMLQPRLLTFMHRFPEVDVHLMVTDRWVDALRENVDLMVRLTNDPPLGLVARRLMTVQQWLLASPGYLQAHDPIRTPDDLMRHSCLSLGEQERDNRWRFYQDNEVREVLVQGRFTANHSEMRLAAVEAGLGVGCVPDFVALEALNQGRVQRVLPDWSLEGNYQGTAHLLYAPALRAAPKVQVLIEHLIASFKSGSS